jgi:adenylosuccinate synthase
MEFGGMENCFQILATNAGGIPYITTTNTTIGTETVDIALGFRRI